MAFYSITGSKFEFGAVVAQKSTDFVAADLTTALAAAVEVKEPQTLAGSVADEWALAEFTNVTDGRTRVQKVSVKAKAVELVFKADPLDAGQLAVRAAERTITDYACRLSFGDKPLAGASPKPSTRSFIGQVVLVEDDMSGTDHMMKVTIQPNSNIIRTSASPT